MRWRLTILTNSIIGMIRRRWRSERPYLGHTIDSLRSKVACAALAEWARELVRQELAQRNQQNP